MRSAIVSIVAISAVSSALGLASSLFVLHIYDRVLSTRSLFTLVVLALVFGAMLLGAGLLDVLRGRIFVRMANLVEYNSSRGARSALFHRPGSHSTKDIPALDNARAARQALTSPSAGALFDVLWTPIFLLACFLIHPVVGFTVLGCGLVLTAVMLTGQRTSTSIRDEVRATETREAELLRALAGALPTYWATRREQDLAAAWRAARAKAMRTFTIGADRALMVAMGTRTLRGLVQILVLAVAAWLAVGSEVSVGGIFAASLLASRMLQPLEILASGWSTAREAWAAVRRAWGTPSPSPGTEVAEASRQPNVRLATGIEALHAFAGPRASLPPAIRDATVAIAPGEVLGIMGPVGAGKSTLLKLLVGLVPALEGVVRIDGADPWLAKGSAVQMGYMGQTPAFVPGTLAENVTSFDPVTDMEAVTGAVSRAGLHGAVSRLPCGLDTILDEVGRPLSEGERQLAALARALYARPAVLALDMPETSIGPDGEAAVSRAICDTTAAGGAVILASHSPRLLRHATRIALLGEGRIIRLLSPNELLGVMREERRDVRSA